MDAHLYLSLMPEALVASQLSPEDFGAYYAVGTEHKTQGQAAFFEIDRAPEIPEDESGLHLYHEIAPLRPIVVSSLGPRAFHQFLISDSKKNINVPALAWVECKLGELARNPEMGEVFDLPYENIDHLRSCLIQLRTKNVSTKMVDRLSSSEFRYRTIKNGVFYGTLEGLAMFALPSDETLKAEHYQWWRSAQM